MDKLSKCKIFLHTMIFGTLIACLMMWYFLPEQTPVYLAGEFQGFGDKNRLLVLLIALPFAYLPHEYRTNHAESEESTREFDACKLRNVKRKITAGIIICGLLLALYGTVCFNAFTR